MSRSKVGITACAIAVTYCSTLAESRAQTIQPRTQDSSVQTFLAHKNQEQSNRNTILQQRGRTAAYQAMLPLAESAVSRMRFGASQTPKLQSSLRDSLKVDMAQRLAVVGHTAATIRKLRLSGYDPVAASGAAMRGGSTLLQLAMLADTVVVGEVVSYHSNEPGVDGFGSSSYYKIIEIMKGSCQIGDRVAVRQLSGTRRDGTVLRVSSDIMPNAGERYLLLLSSEMYKQTALETSMTPLPGSSIKSFVLYSMPYSITGSVLSATSSGLPSVGPLTQVRADLKRLHDAG